MTCHYYEKTSREVRRSSSLRTQGVTNDCLADCFVQSSGTLSSDPLNQPLEIHGFSVLSTGGARNARWKK